MALLGVHEDTEYLPEYGTVVVRDDWPAREESLPEHENALLGELATEALAGTIATAGDGWLHGHAGDPYQSVRLEAHDTEPPSAGDAWEDVVETPFHSRSGAVALGLLTGGTDDGTLELGARGSFRARVSRRAADEGEEGDVWLVQFWPAPARQEPPRWLRRGRPALSGTGRERYVWAASDLASVAAWSDPARTEGLAGRLLLPEAELPALLEHAVARRLVAVDGETVTALPRRPPEPAPPAVWTPPRHETEPVSTPGGPPAAGMVAADGTVVVWRDGEPVPLGKAEGRHCYTAWETPAGIAVFTTAGPGTLVRWDGEPERLPADLGSHPVRSADGRLVAGTETHVGRRSWDQVHVVDLADGSVASLPRQDELGTRVHGIHGGAVFYTRLGESFRWVPGERPEPLPVQFVQLDALSGAAVIVDGGELAVLTPGCARLRLPQGEPVQLVPGGELVHTCRYAPPALETNEPGSGARTAIALPEGTQTSTSVPTGPVWEDRHTALFTAEGLRAVRGFSGLVRCHVPTGALEHVPLPSSLGYRPFLVRPVLDRES
ncbi:hypothetical protein [Prauserella flavalba]|uniref:hypothetical protein n=1 Tax=Prauserella flavalba TaxID=1477506 RepID=UPI0036EA0FE6